MNRRSRLKEKHEKSSRHSLRDCDEGSAARTRPFSFEEIMLRRENKKLSENVKEGTIESGNILKEEIVENVSNAFESERGYKHNNDSSPIVEKHASDKLIRSRKKEQNSSMKEDALVKGKNRESRVSDTKLKDKENKGMSYKAKLGRNNKHKHTRRKNDEWSTDDSENEAEKKHSRDLADRDRHAERSRGDLERESKRKYRNGDDEKNRDRNAAKKHDPGKQHNLDISGRKDRKESSKSRYEESSLKRRRSRSREREDRIRRSISPSTRAHKHTSHHGGEQRELSSHSLRDKSGRQHSDIDRNRVSTNGSSSHYRRHSGYTSGLGGYSPRKRKTEAAIKTPSPYRSPEKKSAGWDRPPVGTAAVVSGSVPSNFLSSKQDVAATVNEMVSAVSAASTTVKSLAGGSNAFSSKKNYSFDSVQLTQATRPMRRLYVENIPASASEKALMECFNKFLLAYGINHIQGAQPCINCTMHKEKGQALVEFLTPEDASVALSFDGSSFSGSILKIRRPKDFVEVAFIFF
uniref:RRM domain-containing protein n=1 Tax=Fagus sylvatica TaxID=28930 RepID=A0A2N9FFS8_FAGSY